PSISVTQKTIDLIHKKNTELVIKGRHDPCIVPRATVVIESALAIALMDIL
ncbi:MAG: chorismate synthase, partial [Clostridia bacterium]|nr:chorismate synthase [Clostridia bacterium]